MNNKTYKNPIKGCVTMYQESKRHILASINAAPIQLAFSNCIGCNYSTSTGGYPERHPFIPNFVVEDHLRTIRETRELILRKLQEDPAANLG